MTFPVLRTVALVLRLDGRPPLLAASGLATTWQLKHTFVLQIGQHRAVVALPLLLIISPHTVQGHLVLLICFLVAGDTSH